ncbi:unnamed protein product [Brassica oleracea var. botrytis]
MGLGLPLRLPLRCDRSLERRSDLHNVCTIHNLEILAMARFNTGRFLTPSRQEKIISCIWYLFGTMHAGIVTYNITQYSGVRKMETVTVAEVNAYVLNSPLRRFTDPKGSAGQETQQERPEELSFLRGALS